MIIELILLVVHAHFFLSIYEILTERRKKSIRYIFLIVFCIIKYSSGFVLYLNHIEPMLLSLLLIAYGLMIDRKKSATDYFTFAIVTFSIDCIVSIVTGSFAGILLGIVEKREPMWTNIFVTICRCMLIVLLVWHEKTVVKIKQSWVFSIIKVSAVIILLIEQVLCLSYSVSIFNYGEIAIACIYLASMYTIFWLVDHYHMLKIQDVYAEDNRQMSQKLHRSREILPAIANYVSNMEQAPDEEMRQKLETVCHDYGKELGGREMSVELFDSTGIDLVDLLLRTKILECEKLDIELDVFVNARMDTALKHVDISEGELARMMGDLIQNAVHALEPIMEKMILLLIAVDETNHLLIQIYDSGILFPPEVLEHFGERGRTTWGTGNGLADMMETLQRAGASLEICQSTQDMDVFTKCITICFDGKGSVDIKK